MPQSITRKISPQSKQQSCHRMPSKSYARVSWSLRYYVYHGELLSKSCSWLIEEAVVSPNRLLKCITIVNFAKLGSSDFLISFMQFF